MDAPFATQARFPVAPLRRTRQVVHDAICAPAFAALRKELKAFCCGPTNLREMCRHFSAQADRIGDPRRAAIYLMRNAVLFARENAVNPQRSTTSKGAKR